ncbi:hypothetical protein [Lactococcus lactis]|uniref:hypothetical protein n=1 Tax=Lactococcus lactis TaxID=1358 RepID=UPI0011D1F6AF|nr:hypothetical protein [Lactococcus lactis]MCI2139777.1 hypothetical protein [Lactococcus lactis]
MHDEKTKTKTKTKIHIHVLWFSGGINLCPLFHHRKELNKMKNDEMKNDEMKSKIEVHELNAEDFLASEQMNWSVTLCCCPCCCCC